MLSLMKLVPKSADCQGEGPETGGSPLLLRRCKPGHSHGCSTAAYRWTVRGGYRRELLLKSHVRREHQACPLHLSSAPPAPLGFLPVAKTKYGQSPAAEWSRLSSEQPPVSCVRLPSKTSRHGLSSSSGYPSGRMRM